MRECKLIFGAASSPHHPMGMAVSYAVCTCITHNMPIEMPVGVGDLCSIGRIEQAADAAVERINAAAKLADRRPLT